MSSTSSALGASETVSGEPYGDYTMPWWPPAAGLLICAVGLGVAGYLTYAHYTSATALACPDKGFIDCAKVTTSKYSHILGIPVSVLGLVFFASMVPFQLPRSWRSMWAPLRAARLGATIVGVGTVVWLLYAELFLLNNLCLYCTAVHVLTFLIFISTALGTVATAPLPEEAYAS